MLFEEILSWNGWDGGMEYLLPILKAFDIVLDVK